MTVLIISQRDWKIEQIKNYRIIYINGLHRKSNKCWAMYQMGTVYLLFNTIIVRQAPI